MERKYAYSIYPKKPIKTLPELGLLRTAKTLLLNENQVLECLKSASVYRRFNANNNIRVTVSNLARLHRDEFISEEEWNNKIAHEEAAKKLPCSEPVLEEVKIVEEKIILNYIAVENNTISEEEVTTMEDTESVMVEENKSDIVEENSIDDTTAVEETVNETDAVENAVEETVVEPVVEVVAEEQSNTSEVEDVQKEEKPVTSKTTVNYNNKKKH